MKKKYRLPNNKLSGSLDYYIRSWKKVAKPIIKKTGWTLIAFNPGFLFMDKNNQTISLTVSAVKDLT